MSNILGQETETRKIDDWVKKEARIDKFLEEEKVRNVILREYLKALASHNESRSFSLFRPKLRPERKTVLSTFQYANLLTEEQKEGQQNKKAHIQKIIKPTKGLSGTTTGSAGFDSSSSSSDDGPMFHAPDKVVNDGLSCIREQFAEEAKSTSTANVAP